MARSGHRKLVTTKKRIGVTNIHEFITDAPTTITLPQETLVVDPKDVIKGRYYCYLCVNFDEEVKTNTHVGHSVAPPEKVKLMNLDKDPTGATSHWTLIQSAGPFVDNVRAKAFREFWKYKSRGHTSRMGRGVFLSRDFNRKLRSVGILPNTPAWDRFHVEIFDLRNEDDA